MNEGLQIQLNKGVKFLIGEKKSLMCNTNNAEGLFVSNECRDIIETAVREKICFQELFKSIEDDDSRNYMRRLAEELDKLGMWKHEDTDKLDCSVMSISYDITNDCNLRCRHCCVSAGANGKEFDLSTEDIINNLYKIALIQPFSIIISGGEPLVRTDFFEIIQCVRKFYDGSLMLMTNATLIDKKTAAFIEKNFYSVDVSIDGIDEESCSYLGGKGTFQKCLTGIENLKDAGVKKITASMVVTSQNKHLKKDFHLLCDKLEIRPVFRCLDNSGRAREIYEEAERKEACFDYTKMEEYFEKNKIYRTKPQIFACQGAKREFQIDSVGNIFPCGVLMDDMFSMGNLCEIEDFKDYLENRKYKNTKGYKNFRSFFPDQVELCRDCNKNLLCFSCVNEVRRFVESGRNQKLCKENQCYFDLYWKEYEGV